MEYDRRRGYGKKEDLTPEQERELPHLLRLKELAEEGIKKNQLRRSIGG